MKYLAWATSTYFNVPRAISLTASIALVTGCGFINESIDSLNNGTISAIGTLSYELNQANSVYQGDCFDITLTAKNSKNDTVNVSTSTSFDLDNNGGNLVFYSDSDCLNQITTITLNVGESSLTFWAQGPTVENTEIVLLKDSITVTNSAIDVERKVATRIIGQPNAETSLNIQKGLDGPYAVYTDTSGKLYVVDNGANRILVWNSIPTNFHEKPDYVFGQPSLNHYGDNQDGIGPNTLKAPTFLSIAGSKMVISDTGNHRLLLFNSIPTSSNPNADLVLGQADFISNSANRGNANPDADTFSTPQQVWTDGTRIVAADVNNHRVLIWNSWPTTNGQPADLVLGQPDFISKTAGTSQTQMNQPYGVLVMEEDDGFGNITEKLIVSQISSHRLSIWDDFPTTNNESMDHYVGTSSWTDSTSGNSDSQFNTPVGLGTDGTRLFVADRLNNRVLVFNSIPTIGSSADYVLGQSTFGTSTADAGGTTGNIGFNSPRAPTIYLNRLLVSDQNNNRIVVFNDVSNGTIASGMAADLVLGQPNFTSNISFSSGDYDKTLFRSRGVAVTASAVLAADYMNNRVIIWSTYPTSDGLAADISLGQPDLVGIDINAGGTTNSDTINRAQSVSTDGTAVAVTDYDNDRVLLWKSFPTVSGQAADAIIGQTTATGGSGATAINRLQRPYDAHISSNRLFVADNDNHRVMIWDDVANLTTGANAMRVLGQPNFTTSTSNNGNVNQELSSPTCVHSDGTRVFVCDRNNNRILIWNSFPSADHQAADVVIGQVDFTGKSANQGLAQPTASTLSSPMGIKVYNGKMYVADWSNKRVLVWNSIPTTNGEAADWVIGVDSFSSTATNYDGPTNNFMRPFRVDVNALGIFVVDDMYSRVLKFDH